MIEKIPYKILTISWDPTLAMDNPDFGDAQERNIEYGKGVEEIHSITHSKKSLGLGNKQLSDNVFVYPTNSKNQISFLFDAWKIAKRVCRENEIGLVLTQDPFLTGIIGLLVKKKFKSKLLIHYHGDFWHNKNWVKEKWYNVALNVLQRFVLRSADALRVMSEGQKEKFLKTGWAENRVRVISTPVDIKKYDTNNENKKTKIVLHVGRDDKVKDYDTLVKSFKMVKEKISDTKFSQVGADNKLKKEMKVNDFEDIDVMGKKPANEIIDIYNKSAIFVLSSTSESFGKVLVEANAASKPVVSTTTTGAKEIIENGKNGFLVPIGDEEQMADKIIWLLENPREAKEMGEYGRKLVEDRYGNNADKIITFWKDIINFTN
jgi:glycosyltransferase involved in cell wall biosynthesis